ncbi:hypothetical protein [Microtetraspora sp. NBRC 16547]|uniref:hypothetical protein n=1 Tax=Microtetraspora sp. NBRC 16547 TaxID=3030993 RepID=UPI0024A2D6B2|nr:hypothetical protein [Microtetraspora sp. NBRC 16547]GLW96887.1 hypothetical protein Misp02_09740 [Microtetraspora sp. NBRC 16547]
MAEIPGTQNPGTQNPGIETPGTENPNTKNPGAEVDPGGAAALEHARARAHGPLALRLAEPAPPGFVRLSGGDATPVAGEGAAGPGAASTRTPVVALPVWPDGVTPSVLDEYGLAPVPVERSGETRRVLAACLRACWTDLAAEPWPGAPASISDVLACYRALTGRGDDMTRSWAVGALRRLADTGWIIRSGDVVRLGPRCATWPPESHAVLRELVRRLPGPQPADGPATLSLEESGSGDPAPSDLAPSETATSGPVLSDTASSVTASSVAAPSVTGPSDHRPVSAGRDETSPDFDGLLSPYDERRRAELVAALMAVEHAAEPVHEARFAALRDPALRRTLAEMLARRGRTLIQRRDTWISGYDDAVAARLIGASRRTAGARPGLTEGERAVLTLVLVHSVAIPRADGLLSEDTWLSPYPVAVEELRRRTLLPIGELESALRTLRQVGLLTQVKAVSEEAPGGYVPGPQFHRLTAAARRRLQEELILAAGPQTPLATAIRSRRA